LAGPSPLRGGVPGSWRGAESAPPSPTPRGGVHEHSFDFACKSEHSSVTGHGTFTAQGDSAFTASTAADSIGQKATMHIQTDIAGKFVSSDCGDVKPMTPPPAR